MFKVTPLHPCIKEFYKKRRSNPRLDVEIAKELAVEKRSEITRHGIRRDMWTGEKKDVGRSCAELMTAKGFRKQGRSYIKRATSGLIFGGFVDAGGRDFCIAVPFRLFIAKDADMIETSEFSPDQTVPGFWYYYGFNEVELGVLGFHAYIELLDIMSESF
jgi:hypothetical protein